MLTVQDLARFHAYQAAASGVAGILGLWLMRHLLGFTSLATLAQYALFCGSWYCGWVLGRRRSAHSRFLANKSASTLERHPFLPVVGEYALSWVRDE